MPDFGRPEFDLPGFGSQEPSLDAVRRADSFVDALANDRPVVPQDAADAGLAALLGGWRDEMRWPPATGLIAESDAVAALNAGLAQKRPGFDRERRTVTAPRGSRRGLSTIGAAAAAVLCIGGFGAVVAGAGPGDPLYGVRTMFFGSKQVRDDQVGLAAKTELNQVQDLITQGNWEQAQDKLVAVSTQVATIDDVAQKQELLDQFNDLSAKVVERNPEATAPPGVVYTVPPSAAALVPAVEPTSTPGAPPLTTSTTSETPASATTSSSSSSAPASTTSAAAPAPTTSTAVPATAEPTTASAVTTTAEAPRAVSTSAVAPAPQTTVSATAPEPASVAATPAPAAPAAPAQPAEPLPTAVITTTLVPVPAG
jgi:hypothetical protein